MEYEWDEPAYRGSHNPSDVVMSVQWTIADLLKVMNDNDIALTDENIETLLSSREIRKSFQDRSIEEGWETLDILVGEVDGLTYERETQDVDTWLKSLSVAKLKELAVTTVGGDVRAAAARTLGGPWEEHAPWFETEKWKLDAEDYEYGYNHVNTDSLGKLIREISLDAESWAERNGLTTEKTMNWEFAEAAYATIAMKPREDGAVIADQKYWYDKVDERSVVWTSEAHRDGDRAIDLSITLDRSTNFYSCQCDDVVIATGLAGWEPAWDALNDWAKQHLPTPQPATVEFRLRHDAFSLEEFTQDPSLFLEIAHLATYSRYEMHTPNEPTEAEAVRGVIYGDVTDALNQGRTVADTPQQRPTPPAQSKSDEKKK